eukprot:TRINITY_DN9178_c0_g1_i3.p1 TRINITY_DN9178_c0_g1~~TRINITY_DN9178_c0_g1_i3.p1  ORF type:complete len:2883 (+),score=310.67 TRINITY_DN9178_c0_g1_i3:773-8650(+)
MPLVASEFSVDEKCELHKYNLTMDGKTGIVSGTIAYLEDSETITCQVLAHDRARNVQHPGELTLIFEKIAYPYKTLIAEAGKSWTPALATVALGLNSQESETASNKSKTINSVAGALDSAVYTYACTPTLPWLSLDAKTGTLTVVANESEDLLPKLASCTVSVRMVHSKSTKIWTTDLSVVVPVDPLKLYLVHRSIPEVPLANVAFTADENVGDYLISRELLPVGRQSTLDAPVSWHIDCGANTSHHPATGAVSMNGHDVFVMSRDGSLRGKPSSKLFDDLDSGLEANLKNLSCRLYGLLPFTKRYISLDFSVSINDNICWRKGRGTFKYVSMVANSFVECMRACRHRPNCAAFSFHNETCHSAQASASNGDVRVVYEKMHGCSPNKRCFESRVMGTHYLGGQFCPHAVMDGAHPLYVTKSLDGSVSLYLQKLHWGKIAGDCPFGTSWIIRRSNDMDLIRAATPEGPSLVELRGDILGCIMNDVAQRVLDGSGEPLHVILSGSSDVPMLVNPTLYSCPSPLVERDVYMTARKLSNEFADHDAAKLVFRFDDTSTDLVDDYSLDACECMSGNFGNVFPVADEAFESIPDGSGNAFFPHAQQLASGQVSCPPEFLAHVLTDGADSERCELAAVERRIDFFWIGESNGESACRLYTKCEKLVAERSGHGTLFGFVHKKVCAVANPDECWYAKRRHYREGFQSAVQVSQCLFEHVFQSCDSLQRLGIATVEDCGRCRYLQADSVSRRSPLPQVFRASTQLKVSCHPDKFAGFLNSTPVDGMQLTCVDGKWITGQGDESMVDFSCESGFRLTSPRANAGHLSVSQRTGRDMFWWDEHYGYSIRDWKGLCLTSSVASSAGADISFPTSLTYPNITKNSVAYADWSSSFDVAGWVAVNGFITGLKRSSCNGLHCLEGANFMSPPQLSEAVDTVDTDWAHSFDHEGWSACEPGHFLSGFRRGSCGGLHCLEEVRCARKKSFPAKLVGCYETDWTSSFDIEGVSGCNDGDAITKIYRSSCSELNCLEKVMCCPVASQPCPDGQVRNAALECEACPCADGFNCTCARGAFGLAWSIDMPIAGQSDYFVVTAAFGAASNSSGCLVSDQALDDTASTVTRVLAEPGRGGVGRMTFKVIGSSTCSGVSKLSIRPRLLPSWQKCNQTDSLWQLTPVANSNGLVRLVLHGTISKDVCATLPDGQLRPCSASEELQLFLPEDLVGLLGRWTLGEHGNIVHPCDGHDSSCAPLANTQGDVLKSLTTAGIVGDTREASGGQEHITFLSSFELTTREGRYLYSYTAYEVPYEASTCTERTTPCSAASKKSNNLYVLEAHNVRCGNGEGLKTFEFKACTDGFQYRYTCCRVHGASRCSTASQTAWTDSSAWQGALVRHPVRCAGEGNGILNGFGLESKDPGNSNSEIRYVSYCCSIAESPLIRMIRFDKPFRGSYRLHEGIYLPRRKELDGRSVFESSYLYSRVPRKYQLIPDRFEGVWQLLVVSPVTNRTEVVREFDNVYAHPLQFPRSDEYDITALASMRDVADVQGPNPNGPLRRVFRGLADTGNTLVGLKASNAKLFKPSREYKAFDEAQLTPWMPNAPKYRPYCALRDSVAWKTLADAQADEESGWGISGRNKVDVLNSPENRARVEETAEDWHPCKHYFNDDSRINWPAFRNDFDPERYLAPFSMNDLKRVVGNVKKVQQSLSTNIRVKSPPPPPATGSGSRQASGAEPTAGTVNSSADNEVEDGAIPSGNDSWAVTPEGKGTKCDVKESGDDEVEYKCDSGAKDTITRAEYTEGGLEERLEDPPPSPPPTPEPTSPAPTPLPPDCMVTLRDRDDTGAKNVEIEIRMPIGAMTRIVDIMSCTPSGVHAGGWACVGCRSRNSNSLLEMSTGHALTDAEGAEGDSGAEEETEVEEEPTLYGIVPEALEKCTERQHVREATFGQEIGKLNKERSDIDLSDSIAKEVCGKLPSSGFSSAPMGIGPTVEVDWGRICADVSYVVHDFKRMKNERWVNARTSWKSQNDAVDQCSDFVEGQMYKLFCDLHCIEDAVFKGNSAVLQSLKTLESHIVKTMGSMMKHYSKELYEKVAETQTQIDSNDQEVLSVLKNYVSQMMDQNSKYYADVVEEVRALGSQNAESLQQSYANLQALDALHQRYLEATRDGSINRGDPKNMTQTFASSLRESTEEIALWSEAVRVRNGEHLNEEQVMPLVQAVRKELTESLRKVKQGLQQGNLEKAMRNIQAGVASIRKSRVALARKSIRANTADTFQRRAELALLPVRSRLLSETSSVGGVNRILSAFRVQHRSMLLQAKSFEALSDQLATMATSDMIVRFQMEASNIERGFGKYLSQAHAHLLAKAAAIKVLQEASRADICYPPEQLRDAAEKLAKMTRVEEKHVGALMEAWQSTASSLSRMASILVDGGLLMHYLRSVVAAGAPNLQEMHALRGRTNQTDGDHTGLVSLLGAMEEYMADTVRRDVGGFLRQVRHAFDMSQLLSHMWTDGGMNPPKVEIELLRSSWADVLSAVQTLRQELRGPLRTQLLMQVLTSRVAGRGGAQMLKDRYRVPPGCQTSPDAADTVAWSYYVGEDGKTHAHLISLDAQAAMRCNTTSGLVELINPETLAFEDRGTAALGDFLDELHGE